MIIDIFMSCDKFNFILYADDNITLNATVESVVENAADRIHLSIKKWLLDLIYNKLYRYEYYFLQENKCNLLFFWL